MLCFQEITLTLIILRRWTLEQQAPHEDTTLPLTFLARITLRTQIMNHIPMIVRYCFVNNCLVFYKRMFFCKLIDLFLIVDSISHKSLDFLDEVSQSPIEPINLSGQEIETINETTDKTTVSKPAKQINKFLPIRK